MTRTTLTYVSATLSASFVLLGILGTVEAQTTEELAAQTRWMNGWSSWMNAMGQHNAEVKMVEAQAKLLKSQAAMVTAIANANKTNAEALQGLEKVQEMSLDNSHKKAETFYAKRAMYDKYRDMSQMRRPQSTEADVRRRSQASVPERLNEEHIDPKQGKIRWPAVLQEDAFWEHRAQIESLFASRYQRNEPIHREVRDVAEEMHAGLRSLIAEVPPSEYVEARRFIRSLVYEAQFTS